MFVFVKCSKQYILICCSTYKLLNYNFKLFEGMLMIYNTLGKTGLKVSRLGFGAMRLPTISSNADIDEVEATKMFDYAIENGVNIFDTAYMYHNETISGSGKGELFLGEYLKENNLRDEIILQTKSPSWYIGKKSDFEFYLDDQLEKLQTDYIDIYMLHSLTSSMWNKLKDFDVLDFLDESLSSGKVKHVGFSAHTKIDTLIKILNEYPKWGVALTQMNYIDEYYQSGASGLKYLKHKDIGTVIMEPMRGGRLIHNVPNEVKVWWEISEVKRTPVEWALQYLWNRDDVDCVLSGMSSLKQVKENVKYASNVDIINEYDQEIIREVARQYHASSVGNQCTQCGYCIPCPNGVDIVNCFNEYNIAQMLNDPKASALQYFSTINPDSRAECCVECRECLPLCTQNLNIPDELKKVHKYFGSEFNHF